MTKPARTSDERRRTELGFALIAVLWLSAILSAFAIAVSLSVRSHAFFIRNAVSDSLAEGLADGVVRMIALQVGRSGPVVEKNANWISCNWAGEATAWTKIQDQSGLVDLNTASPRLMTALLEGLGLNHGQSNDITAAIRDYRDTDRVSDQGQAETSPYAGRLFGPKNSPFETVEELDQIPGISAWVRLQLKELTTVYSQQAGFDFGTAPDTLLAILGLTRSSVAGLNFSSPRSSRVTAIIAAVETNDGARFARRAMIERTGQPDRPFAILAWDTMAWPEPLQQSPRLTDCLSTLPASFSSSL